MSSENYENIAVVKIAHWTTQTHSVILTSQIVYHDVFALYIQSGRLSNTQDLILSLYTSTIQTTAISNVCLRY